MSVSQAEDGAPDFELEKIIRNQNLHDVFTDTAQLATDIPIIGTLVKGIKFISELNEEIFAQKIKEFLYELKDIPQGKRQKKIDEVNQSEKLQYSIGLVLLDQLQRIDMNYKPKVLGKLFSAFLSDVISLDEYLRLTHIVENAFFRDLQALKEYSDNGIYKSSAYNSLSGGELMSVDFLKTYNRSAEKQLQNVSGESLSTLEDNHENYPELSEFGKLLLKML